jgi:hypothetical protein
MSREYAELRLDGPHGIGDVAHKVTQAIRAALANGDARLLVRIDGVTGLAPPSLGVRHQIIREWAIASSGAVTLALVARPDFIDPQRFGVVTAANFGMHSNVFDNEADAVEWLRAQE